MCFCLRLTAKRPDLSSNDAKTVSERGRFVKRGIIKNMCGIEGREGDFGRKKALAGQVLEPRMDTNGYEFNQSGAFLRGRSDTFPQLFYIIHNTIRPNGIIKLIPHTKINTSIFNIFCTGNSDLLFIAKNIDCKWKTPNVFWKFFQFPKTHLPKNNQNGVFSAIKTTAVIRIKTSFSIAILFWIIVSC